MYSYKEKLLTMIIINEKRSFEEMSFLDPRKAPKSLKQRAGRLPIDKWFYDMNEKNNLKKVAFFCGNDAKDNSNIQFYYGFIRPPYYYRTGGSAKGSGAPMDDTMWEFRVLHLLSTVPGAKGNWAKTDFKDDNFEEICDYQYDLGAGDHINVDKVKEIVQKFGLIPYTGSILILDLCNRLLKK